MGTSAPSRGREDRDGGRERKKKHVMKSASLLLLRVSLLAVTTCCCSVAAFLPLRHSSISLRKLIIHCRHTATTSSSLTRLKDRKADENDREIIDSNMISQRDRSSNIPNDIGLEIIRGSENDISDEMWGDIEGSAPNQWMVMKNVSYLRFLAFSIICKEMVETYLI
jgi:hypothetical protein